MSKDDKFWLNAFYLLVTLTAAYIGYQLIETVGIQARLVEKYDTWFPLVNNLGAIVIGVATTLGLKSKEDRVEYYLASIAELRKVTWPSYEDTKRMTIVVVVVVLIFAAVLGIFDFTWSTLLKQILT